MYVPFKAGDIVDPGNVPSGEEASCTPTRDTECL